METISSTFTESDMSHMIQVGFQEHSKLLEHLPMAEGHSFPNCLEKNGRKKSYVRFNTKGEKMFEIPSTRIGNKSRLQACLRRRKVEYPILWLTSRAALDAPTWLYDDLRDVFRKEGCELDAGAEEYIKDSSDIFVVHDIYWNKLAAYKQGQKNVFCGDHRVYECVLAIVHSRDVKDAAIEAGIAAAKAKLQTFKPLIDRVSDLELQAEMYAFLERAEKDLEKQFPDAVNRDMNKWAEDYLIPAILNPTLKAIKGE